MRLACIIALCTLLAACGSDGSEQAAEKDTTVAETSAPAEERSGEEAELAELAETYMSSWAEEDWEGVCGTRSRSDRKELARTAGSCERAFEVIAADKPGAAKLLAEARAGDVRIRGSLAGIDIVQPGQTEPATTLGAVKRDGEWLLEDIPDGKTP
jgi:hypothetical protein